MDSQKTLTNRLMSAGMLLRLDWKRKMRAVYPAGSSRGKLLKTLKACSGARVRELADLSGLGMRRLERMLEYLEYEGLIAFLSETDDDERIALTTEGRKAAEKIEQNDTQTENMFDCLSEEDREKLSEILDRLLADWKGKVDDLNDPDDFPERRRFHCFDFSAGPMYHPGNAFFKGTFGYRSGGFFEGGSRRRHAEEDFHG